MSEEELKTIKSLKVQELRDRLTELGLDTAGTKPELIKRLQEALVAAAAVQEPQEIQELDSAEKEEEKVQKPQSPANVPVIEVSGLKSEKLTDAQKKTLRAERFGVPVAMTEEEKKNLRTAKFGGGPTVTVSGQDPEALKKRGERFGTTMEVMHGNTDINSEALKKRAERFGISVNPTKSSKGNNKIVVQIDPELAKSRTERFGPITDDLSSFKSHKKFKRNH